MQDYSRNSQQMEYKGHMFRAWPLPSLDCPRCGSTRFAVPLIERGKIDGINWTFLFLARQLQHCIVPQLRHHLTVANTEGRSVMVSFPSLHKFGKAARSKLPAAPVMIFEVW
ncbi:hypothetical protein SLA2020_459330 [Shorea laevis]